MEFRGRWMALAVVASGCVPIYVVLDDRDCNDGQCIADFECHTPTNTCVPAIVRSCDGDGVCWSEIEEGDACSVLSSFVPCGPREDCLAGCRTCEADGWSECRHPPCPQDLDLDGVCDTVDGCVDDDSDGLGNGNLDNIGCASAIDDSDDTNNTVCADTDSDSCDDCASTRFDPLDDGDDTDADGTCDAGDPDDDGDGVADGDDSSPLDALRCRDSDSDGCDDCSQGGPPTPDNDGVDTDGDGACDAGDPDDDNDGVPDSDDPATLDPDLCGDTDQDNCDDCAIGFDDFGPASDSRPDADGADSDGDGYCTASDCDDRSPTVHPDATEGPAGTATCTDGNDNDCDQTTDVDDRDCWLDPAWQRRKPLMVESELVSGSHTAFPVLVSLLDSDLRDAARADGGDIRFTAADGATPLAHELEWFEASTGRLVAWVLVADISIAADQRLFVYYGCADPWSEDAATVWDDDHVGVWHLDNDPTLAAPQIHDSNGDHHMRALGSMTAADRVVARVGRGLDLDGSNDYLRTPGLIDAFPATTVTIQLWFLPRGEGVVVDETGQAATNTGWHDSQIEILNTGQIYARVWGMSAVALGQVDFDAWHHVVLRYDASTRTLDGFLDGTEAASDVIGDRSIPTDWDAGAEQHWAIGAGDTTNLGSGDPFDGVVDEVRVSRVARSTDWIQTGFRNQNEPGNFVTVGDQETY